MTPPYSCNTSSSNEPTACRGSSLCFKTHYLPLCPIQLAITLSRCDNLPPRHQRRAPALCNTLHHRSLEKRITLQPLTIRHRPHLEQHVYHVRGTPLYRRHNRRQSLLPAVHVRLVRQERRDGVVAKPVYRVVADGPAPTIPRGAAPPPWSPTSTLPPTWPACGHPRRARLCSRRSRPFRAGSSLHSRARPRPP